MTRHIYGRDGFQEFHLKMDIMGWLWPSAEKGPQPDKKDTSNIPFRLLHPSPPTPLTRLTALASQEGFLNCPYLHAAADLGDKLSADDQRVVVDLRVFFKQQWENRVRALREEIPGSESHTSSPFVYEGCSKDSHRFVGGYTDFARLAKQRHGAEVPDVE
ncbi:hypothetical protein BC936DRAFT_142930 [Jimgerdemannia flammicorona]|uniref:Uncharacterized protein n=2 Tax=Jimgerdemannia flammicorona TaxID=994334 RepID=A0A433Q6I6_9FUNG|nr:hypothetical protein BC936DRAFT_142930 [Jimgerdemannia flammicorona]RUS25398.1 hypothetical protein BC938DRAFT_472232 [Jimgerdemannia flammicorona]